jgi:hypothetical protein
VNKPWWTDKTEAQTRASLVPTREVHYFRDEETGQGLVMLYTDRPATEFWKLYVQDEVHDRPEIDRDKRLPKLFLRYLAKELKQEAGRHPVGVLRAEADGAGSPENPSDAAARSMPPAAQDGFLPETAEGSGVSPQVLLAAKEKPMEKVAEDLEERVEKFGIRDWSREPYGAACHTWRPRAKSWEVLGRLKAFSLPGSGDDHKNVHVCGEAYSDYNGFIEGALRSADGVLRTVD